LEPVAVPDHRHGPRAVRDAAGGWDARRAVSGIHRRLAAAERDAHPVFPRFVAAAPRRDGDHHDLEGLRPTRAARRSADGTAIMNGDTTQRIRISGQLITGLLLASLGVLFMLDNMEIVRAREVLRYWPAVLLIIGVSQVLQSKSTSGMIAGSIWILFGGVLL